MATAPDSEELTDSEELSPTEQITRLLESVKSDTPRHRALTAALEFKGNWVKMAHRIKTVDVQELWKKWGFESLKNYAKTELQLTRGEFRKIREGYAWLEEEAPELAEEAEQMEQESTPPSRPVPDMDTVDQLAKGYRDVQEEKVPRDTYEELKQAALDGERSRYQLRREFKEAVPEHKRDKKAPDPRKHFRKALKAFEKALAELEELQDDQADPELAERARKLRDEMSQLVEEKQN